MYGKSRSGSQSDISGGSKCIAGETGAMEAEDVSLLSKKSEVRLIRYIRVCFVGMDVYRNFRKHFPAYLLGTSGSPVKKGSQQALKLEEATSTMDSPSPTRGKGKKSSSDVQLGLQKLVLSVPTGEDPEAARQLVRLFVIPSTSGLAAGYTVCLLMQRFSSWPDA